MMAEITLTLKATRRWWLMPLLYCAVAWHWLAGREEVDPRLIDWVVRHGIMIEVSP